MNCTKCQSEIPLSERMEQWSNSPMSADSRVDAATLTAFLREIKQLEERAETSDKGYERQIANILQTSDKMRDEIYRLNAAYSILLGRWKDRTKAIVELKECWESAEAGNAVPIREMALLLQEASLA